MCLADDSQRTVQPQAFFASFGISDKVQTSKTRARKAQRVGYHAAAAPCVICGRKKGKSIATINIARCPLVAWSRSFTGFADGALAEEGT